MAQQSPTPRHPLPPLPLDEAEALAWGALHRRLRQLQGFGLLIYLVHTPALASRLQTRLAEFLRQRGQVLVSVQAAHSEDFADYALSALLREPPANLGAYWLDLHRGMGQPAWDAQRRTLLTRLNERRSRLEAEFAVPLIVLLPAAGIAEAASLAPDLWHIRVLTAELQARLPAADGANAVQVSASANVLGGGLLPQGLEEDVQRALDYWHRQWQACFDDFTVGELRSDHPKLGALSIWDGVNAIETCLAYGRHEQARGVATDLLGLARLRVSTAPESGRDRALRDVSVSLNNVGRVAQAQGDWSGAEQVYRESLELSRELAKRLGGTPESLRDVSVSLNNVGRVAQAQGDWSGAEQVYRESLELRRELAKRLGGTPESLDDIAVALVRNAELAQGQRQALLAEAATIWGGLVQRCPQVARYASNLKWVQDALKAGPNIPTDRQVDTP